MASIFSLLFFVLIFQFYFTSRAFLKIELDSIEIDLTYISDYVTAQKLVNNPDTIPLKLLEFNRKKNGVTFKMSLNSNIDTSNQVTPPWIIEIKRVINYEGQYFGNIVASINILHNSKFFNFFIFNFLVLFYSVALLIFLFWIAAYNFPDKYFLKPLGSLLQLLETKIIAPSSNDIHEALEFKSAKNKALAIINHLESSIASESNFKIASQVTHDIKSPVAVLDMLITESGCTNQNDFLAARSAINRIKDISNDLLNSNRRQNNKIKFNDISTTAFYSPAQLAGFILSIIEEKRILLGDSNNVCINYLDGQFLDVNSYKIDSVQFKRVISNLLNNAVEALIESKGIVSVNLSESFSNYLSIEIRDNGVGMSQEILEKVGKRGVSFFKKNGNGIGLYSTIETVKKWGGEVKLTSETMKGTSVLIILPCSKH